MTDSPARSTPARSAPTSSSASPGPDPASFPDPHPDPSPNLPIAVLVLAKVPEPGLVKTRLCPPLSPAQAADLAAAALLDSIDAADDVPGATPVVVLTGDPERATRRLELQARLQSMAVLPQRGDGLGARIVAAHQDAAALLPGSATLQIGMDTPQAGPLLNDAATVLRGPDVDAVLGLAVDGGWWVLGLRNPADAALIADVPTSLDDTGARTLAALRAAGLRVSLLPELVDVDTAADAVAVAAAAPRTRFAAAVAALPPDTLRMTAPPLSPLAGTLPPGTLPGTHSMSDPALQGVER